MAGGHRAAFCKGPGGGEVGQGLWPTVQSFSPTRGSYFQSPSSLWWLAGLPGSWFLVKTPKPEFPFCPTHGDTEL